MIVDEKTYKDVIYKIASKDPNFKRLLDSKIEAYKASVIEIEELKSKTYTFCNKVSSAFKFKIDMSKPLSGDEYIENVSDMFNDLVLKSLGRAIINNSAEFKDLQVYKALKGILYTMNEAELKDLYIDYLKYLRLKFGKCSSNIYEKFDEYSPLIKDDYA